jgi:N-acetylglutamate synthase-like GNAT family acetyltransferase
MPKPKFTIAKIGSNEQWMEVRDFVKEQFENPLQGVYYYAKNREGKVVGALVGNMYRSFMDALTDTTVYDCFVTKGIAVDHNTRRQGCGRSLVEFLEDDASEIDGIRVNFYAEVLEQSAEFWTAIGYKRVGEGSALWKSNNSRPNP